MYRYHQRNTQQSGIVPSRQPGEVRIRSPDNPNIVFSQDEREYEGEPEEDAQGAEQFHHLEAVELRQTTLPSVLEEDLVLILLFGHRLPGKGEKRDHSPKVAPLAIVLVLVEHALPDQ